MERIGVIFALLLLALPTQAAVQMYYLHNDHLGTPRVVTDQNQAVVWKGHLKPFGETEVETEIITNHRRFPGQRLDIETRLYYNYFRDYDPRTGRYIQSDPIGLSGGINTYEYVNANPINRSDPFGLWSLDGGYYGPWGGSVAFYGSGTAPTWASVTGMSFQFGGGTKGPFLQYDPKGSLPGNQCAAPGNSSLGVFAQFGGAVGPLYGGFSTGAGFSTNVGGSNDGMFPILSYGYADSSKGVLLGGMSPRPVGAAGIQLVIPFNW